MGDTCARTLGLFVSSESERATRHSRGGAGRGIVDLHRESTCWPVVRASGAGPPCARPSTRPGRNVGVLARGSGSRRPGYDAASGHAPNSPTRRRSCGVVQGRAHSHADLWQRRSRPNPQLAALQTVTTWARRPVKPEVAGSSPVTPASLPARPCPNLRDLARLGPLPYRRARFLTSRSDVQGRARSCAKRSKEMVIVIPARAVGDRRNSLVRSTGPPRPLAEPCDLAAPSRWSRLAGHKGRDSGRAIAPAALSAVFEWVPR